MPPDSSGFKTQPTQGVENGSRAEEQMVVTKSKRLLDQPDEPAKRQRTARTDLQGDETKIEVHVLPTQQ